MAKIEAVLFWMGGVVTQSIPAVIGGLLEEMGSKSGPDNVFPGFSRSLEQFSLGYLDDLSLCRQLAEGANLSFPPELIRNKMLNAFAPNEPALAVIEKLSPAYQRWLVVDGPQAWYESIAGRSGLSTVFSSNRLIFLANSRLPQPVPDLFYYLSHTVQFPAECCLLIDPSMKRAVQGINHGFPTAHYVNPRLIEREFYLRGFSGKAKIHKKPELSR